MKQKTCPIRNCDKPIPNDTVMCGIHWGMVPTELRMEWLKSRLRSAVERERMTYRVTAHVMHKTSPRNIGQNTRPVVEDLKLGDPVEVELITHDRGRSTKYSTWKPARFHALERDRIICTVRTPAGEAKRSFPIGKVRPA